MPAPDPHGVTIEPPRRRMEPANRNIQFSGRTQRKARAMRMMRNLRRNGWCCEWCGGPVPEFRRADARYCREGCRKRAARARRIAMQEPDKT